MNRYDYKTALLNKINEKTGMGAGWGDMVVSKPVHTDGAVATLNIAPTATAYFKGNVNVNVTRMSLNNNPLLFKKVGTIVNNGSDFLVFKSFPKSQSEFLTLLSERLGVEITSDDLQVPPMPAESQSDVSFTVTALDTSRWFYGSTKVTFVADRTPVIKFEYSRTDDLTVSSSSLSNVVLVDGVQLPAGSNYTIPKGNHTLEIRYFTLTQSMPMAKFNPTRLIALRHYETGNVTGMFQNATTLTSIDEEALYLEYGSCANLFSGCTALVTLPNSLFAPGTIQYSATALLAGTGITKTPATLFKNLRINGPALSEIFKDCVSLKEATGSLFKNVQVDNSIVTVTSLWYNSGVATASPLVLDGLTSINYLSTLFGNCVNLVSAPNGLFDGLSKLTSEYNTFGGCSNLVTAPVKLFDKCPILKTISSTFSWCPKLTAVDPNVFGDCPALTSISGVFSSSGITQVPEKIFSKMPLLNRATTLFDRCAALKAVPGTLFSYSPKLTVMTGLFQYSGLGDIPVNLFAKNVELLDVSNTFQLIKCGDIPADLFLNNTKLKNTSSLFSSVTTTSMPPNLFRACPALEVIKSTFYGLRGGDFKIAAACFPSNALKDISYCFKNSSLTEIEEGTFYNHTGITNLAECFYRSSLRSIPSNLIRVIGDIVSISSLFSQTQATDIYQNALYVNHTGTGPMKADNVFANSSHTASVHGSVSYIAGIVSTTAGFLMWFPVVMSDDEVIRAFEFNIQRPSSGGIDATNMFAGFYYLTGSGLKLCQKIFSVSAGSANFNNTNFIDRSFFLDDYDSLGSPWQSTPRAVNVYNWLTIDAYALGDATAGKNDFVPLYATYYLDVPSSLTIPPSGDVSNVAISATINSWLTGVFFMLGMNVPAASKVSIRRINKTDYASFADLGLRDEVSSVTLLTFDGVLSSDLVAACNNPNNYLLCS
ncbi:hypothetical protein pEaSNUABM54_00040 [Erwinia phage pEa_SNUABM_54]|nr:hypothetical protein pEaSNUABM54_00040 [Erwinia phage pEa_SNUABM_54]